MAIIYWTGAILFAIGCGVAYWGFWIVVIDIVGWISRRTRKGKPPKPYDGGTWDLEWSRDNISPFDSL